MKSRIASAIALALTSGILNLQAQTDGTDAWTGAPGARAEFGGEDGTELFLGGNYIELGITNDGDFGTVGTKPAAFRGTAAGTLNPGGGSNSIGMSYDYDGFGRGDDNPVDYYMPGGPYEAMIVGYNAGSGPVTEAAYALGSQSIGPTTITDESDTATGLLQARVVTVWTGVMRITQVIRFTVNQAYYSNQVTIENISEESWTQTRYMRALDPDNTQFRGGSFDTHNTIVNTIAEDGSAVVLADTSDNASDPIFLANGSRMPLFYYSTFSGARGSIGQTSPFGASAWDSAPAKGTTQDGDTYIGMTFDLGALAPSETATFSYWTSLDSRGVEGVEEEINPGTEPEPEPEPTPEALFESYEHPLVWNTINPWSINLDPNDILAASPDHSMASGALPSGISISDKVISGRFNHVGTYQFTVSSKSGINEVRNSFVIRVIPPTLTPLISGAWVNETYIPTSIITDRSHGDAAVTELLNLTAAANEAFSLGFNWDYVKGDYTFRIIRGALPEGLTLMEKSVNGLPSAVISGTPTQKGEFIFVVSVKDWRERGYQWIRLVVQ
jgi:hypothetical protein